MHEKATSANNTHPTTMLGSLKSSDWLAVTNSTGHARRQVLDLVEDLQIVNARFKTLYNERFNRNFAMEIEFKITEAG